MKGIRRIDETDANAVEAALDEIVEAVSASPKVVERLREAYEVKRRYNPGIAPFESWLRFAWAKEAFVEANRWCGGYTVAKVEKIAEIECLGTYLARTITEKYKEQGVEAYCYVEEGRVTVTFHVPTEAKYAYGTSEIPREMNGIEIAKVIRQDMERFGYRDAEVLWDYDGEAVLPVTGTCRFVS